ncbi:hypothetical protein PCASD_07347 [Puccinia coronata f. sp. avenae]|uniref:RING-type domain-containing protein n=1 Tax=Puccinia coronata f. sp. avenae TaxID=200324 RepID=A0A2N5UST8_9BASI|nr:hypothetical protein PCASD_07347 [Puccinia coronata f. sp. avenae]
MFFVFRSSNPETIELFRSTYYKPKLGLWLLLFILFPTIDRTNNNNNNTTRNTQLTNQLAATNTLTTTTTTTTTGTTGTAITNTEPQQQQQQHHQHHHQDSRSRCPDEYRDHRNNIICPHSPKRLKSIKQRIYQVVIEIKLSIYKCLLLLFDSSLFQQQQLDHHRHQYQYQYQQQRYIQQQQQQQQQQHFQKQQQQVETHQELQQQPISLSTLPQLVLCAPLAYPFLHLIMILHVLLIVQALSLLMEDALIKDACFSGATTNSFRRSSSWPKLWSRFRFRLRKQWSQPAFLEPFTLWVVCVALVALVTRETIGAPGSWAAGQATWHDLPFRARCGWATGAGGDAHSSSSSSSSSSSKEYVSIISAAPILRLLGWLLHRPPFLKPARTLILLECLLAFVSLLQPAQHFLPSRILPKLLRVPDFLLRLRHKKLQEKLHYGHQARHHLHLPNHYHHLNLNLSHPHLPFRYQPNSTNIPPHDHSMLAAAVASSYQDHHQHPRLHAPVVEVETKWLLGVFVEACIGISSIIGYLIVMVHLPYASHYSIPFFLCMYSIKSFARQIGKLVRTSLNTLDCLQLVLYEFSGRRALRRRPARARRAAAAAAAGGGGGGGGGGTSGGSSTWALTSGSTSRRKAPAEMDELEEELELEEEQDWTCSICFEDTLDSDTLDSRSESPVSSSSTPVSESAPPPPPSSSSSESQESEESEESSSGSSKEKAEKTAPTPPVPPPGSSTQPLHPPPHTPYYHAHQHQQHHQKRHLQSISHVNRCVLDCGHAYHTACLVKWLHYQAFCPVCHRPIL